jgi:dethiobiotin synthetase
VVEGAGGLLVPFAWGYTVADLAVETGLEVVLVARAGLGTLNQVLLTVEALHRRELRLRGVVLNGRSEAPDLAEATNPGALARLLPGVPVVSLPRYAEVPALEAARRSVPALAPLALPSRRSMYK